MSDDNFRDQCAVSILIALIEKMAGTQKLLDKNVRTRFVEVSFDVADEMDRERKRRLLEK